jgi:hypothetical protein
MANITVSTDIDALLQSADNAAARDSLGIVTQPAINLGTPLVELKLLGAGPVTLNTSTPAGIFQKADVRGVHTPVEVTDTEGLWDAAAHTFTPAEDGTYLIRWDFVDILFGTNAAAFSHGLPKIGVSIDGVDYLKFADNAHSGTYGGLAEFGYNPQQLFRSEAASEQEVIVNLTAGEVVQFISRCEDMFLAYPYGTTAASARQTHAGPANSPVTIYKL